MVDGFSIKMVREDRPPHMTPKSVAAVSLNGRRFLVVEDDADIAFLVAKIVARAGGEAVTAGTGQQGLDAIDEPWTAFVTDIMLPDMSGLVLMAKVHRLRRTLPILAMSASFSESLSLQASQCGADGFLPKPFSPALLLAHLGRVLNRPTCPT